VAEEIQLMIEYAPSPPHDAGSPHAAPAGMVRHAARTRERVQSDRRVIAERAAARLERGANGANGKSAHALQSARHTLPHLTRDRVVTQPTAEPEVEFIEVLAGDGRSRLAGRMTGALEGFALRAGAAEGIAIDSLEPGTTLIVRTSNSEYRLVILLHPHHVLVQGGTLFPDATIVRLEGATAGGSALKKGWILVGFQMEMWLGLVRVRSSPVRSVSIETVPATWAHDQPLVS
jgi:hypothetical protein